MKKRMLFVALIFGMCVISGFIAGYIKRNYAGTVYQALKFAGIDTEQIIYQREEKEHIDLFFVEDDELTLRVVKVREKNGRKNYNITQTRKIEHLFSDEESLISDSESIKNQLEMLSSMEDIPFSEEKESHKSFGKRLFFIGTTQNEDSKNLSINGQKPTDVFTYNYKGVVNYVYYYEELELDHKEIKVRM